MESNIFKAHRKSHIEIGTLYFWTVTINKWQRLLADDDFKKIILSSLQYLSDTGKMDVYAFVIMPNHIHLILRTNQLNGKESVQGAFLKYTSHEFKKLLKIKDPTGLENFKISLADRTYEFWQRDPLAIPLFTKEVAYQKMDYIHNNPLAEHWNLAKHPNAYPFSSSAYYEIQDLSYPFLKDLRDFF